MLLPRVAILVSVGLFQPVVALAAASVSLVAPNDHTVMGDGPTEIRARVTNDATGPVDLVEFKFANLNNSYDFAEGQEIIAPAGWFVSFLNADRAVFTAGSPAAQIPNGGTLDFTLLLLGNGATEILRGLVDATDRWDSVLVRHAAGPVDTLAGPTWTRHGFELTLAATPASVGTGGTVVVRYLIENRTIDNVAKTGIVATPLAPVVTPAGAVTGPAGTTPATLAVLARDAAGELTWTGTAQFAASATFRSRVRNATSTTTSPSVDSNTVTIGRFTARLEITPVSGISGSTFDVSMTVTNHNVFSLGGVVPSQNPATRSAVADPLSIGSATMVMTSGPTPASVPTLGPGNTVIFKWTYTATGAAGSTVAFQGGAIANGTANVTALAVSNTAKLALMSFGVVPDSISAGDTGPLTFVIGNGTAFDLAEDFRFQFPACMTIASFTPVAGYTGVIGGGGNRVIYTRSPLSTLWNAGEILQFPMTFNAVPSPPGGADRECLVDLTLLTSLEKHQIPVLVTENRIALSFSPPSPPPTYTADGNSTVTVTATYTNAGIPQAGKTVSFSTTAGSLSSNSAVTNALGRAIVTLTAPSSATDVTATITASQFNIVEVGSITFTGFAGANLLYLGGTLFERSVAPNTSVGFDLYVQNAGTAAANLTIAGTRIDFTCTTATGTATYTGQLSAPMSVAVGATAALLSFSNATVPATCIATPPQNVFPTFTFNPTRTITDSIQITASPTFASVVGLTVEAVEGGSGVRLSWATELEWDNVGFRILRADGAGEPEYLDDFVPATGALFAEYEAFDPAPLGDGLHAWWIEDEAIDGTATRHGPVFLASSSTTAADAPGGAALAGTARTDAPAGIWLDPMDRGDVRLLESDATGFTWEIVPPPFEVTAVPWPVELRDRVRIPGYGVLQEAGLPDLPASAFRLRLPPHRQGVLSIREMDEVEHRDLAPTWWTGESAANGDVFTAPAEPLAPGLRRTTPRAVWPARPVALSTALAGDAPVANIAIHPLRWREEDHVLVQATRLVVRLDLVAAAAAVPARPTAAESRQREIVRGLALAVRATRGGLVRVPLADLVVAGIDPASAAVHRRGAAIPSRLDGDFLVFVSADFESPWSREETYWIAPRSGPAAVLAFEGTEPLAGAAADATLRRLHLEEDSWFAPESAQGSPLDRWFWARVFTGGPASASVTLSVPNGVDSLAGSTITVELQGLYDDAQVFDEHRVEVALGGVVLGEVVLDAHARTRADFAIPAGVLASGDNVLQITNLSAALSHVGLDGVDLQWTAPANAEGAAELAVVSPLGGAITAGGFATEVAWVVDETDPAAPRMLPFTSSFDGTSWLASVESDANQVLRFVTDAAPSPALWTAHGGRDVLDVLSGADYLVVAASPLVADATGFADYRSTNAGGGFRTHVVDVADLYDLLGFGDVDPAALRRYLQLATSEWPAPAPRFVLLAGDSDADPLDHLGFGVPEGMLLSPRLSTSILNVASDVVSAQLGGDVLPDLAIGRIPARDGVDLQASLAKTIAYEAAARDGWDTRQVLVSDDDLPEFDALTTELAALLPLGMTSERLAASGLGAAAVQAQLADAFADGVALVTYAGHGGTTTFGAEAYLSTDDVAFLTNERQPVVLTVNCMNTYFDHPYYDAISESLVRAPAGGAVAFFGSSAVTRDAGHREIALAFHHAFWREPERRLGGVVAQAHASIAWRPDAHELIGSFLLLGDPALRLNVNGTPVAHATLASVSSGRADLSSAGSLDPDGDPLFYRWEIVAQPAGAAASLEATDAASTALIGPAGTYRVRLTVADAHRAGPSDDLVVELRNADSGEGGGGGGFFGCAVGGISGSGIPAGSLALLAGLLLARRRRA